MNKSQQLKDTTSQPEWLKNLGKVNLTIPILILSSTVIGIVLIKKLRGITAN